MRAVYLKGYKDWNNVVVGQRPEPKLGAGDVLVKVHAAGINRVDLYMFNGGAGITHELPLIFGVDGAGVIEAVGPGVKERKAGDRVVIWPGRICGLCEFCRRGDQMLCLNCKIFGEHIDGSFADYIAVPEACAFPIAESLSFQSAAVLPTAYLTAWRMVTTLGDVRSNDVVLIHGVGGGASLAAMQFCKIANAHVIVTSSSDEKLERAKKLGADDTINYKRDDVFKKVMQLTDGRGVDVVIENVGQQTWPVSMKCVIRGGRIICCGATTGSAPSADLQRIFIRQLQIKGATIGNFEEFRTLINAAERHLFEPYFDQIYSLEEAPAALQRLDRGEQLGKMGLKVN